LLLFDLPAVGPETCVWLPCLWATAVHAPHTAPPAFCNGLPAGLSGSGKSTVSCTLEHMLHDLGHFTSLLDGDNIRHGLNKDLGFT
jgi:hypothetical protein